jgi:hypothetical protein
MFIKVYDRKNTVKMDFVRAAWVAAPDALRTRSGDKGHVEAKD